MEPMVIFISILVTVLVIAIYVIIWSKDTDINDALYVTLNIDSLQITHFRLDQKTYLGEINNNDLLRECLSEYITKDSSYYQYNTFIHCDLFIIASEPTTGSPMKVSVFLPMGYLYKLSTKHTTKMKSKTGKVIYITPSKDFRRDLDAIVTDTVYISGDS